MERRQQADFYPSKLHFELNTDVRGCDISIAVPHETDLSERELSPFSAKPADSIDKKRLILTHRTRELLVYRCLDRSVSVFIV